MYSLFWMIISACDCSQCNKDAGSRTYYWLQPQICVNRSSNRCLNRRILQIRYTETITSLVILKDFDQMTRELGNLTRSLKILTNRTLKFCIALETDYVHWCILWNLTDEWIQSWRGTWKMRYNWFLVNLDLGENIPNFDWVIRLLKKPNSYFVYYICQAWVRRDSRWKFLLNAIKCCYDDTSRSLSLESSKRFTFRRTR